MSYRPIALISLSLRRLRVLLGMLAVLTVLGCSGAEDQAVSPFQGTGIGISTADIDTSIDPGNDFYRYANGNWLNAVEIPEGSDIVTRQARASAELERRLTTIVEDIAGRPQDDGSPEAIVRDYYRSFVDRASINRQGIGPALGDIRRFQSVDDVGMLSEVIGGTLRADVDPMADASRGTPNLFAIAARPAPDDGRTVPWLMTGGLGLPDRSDYLADTGAARANRAAYRDYVARILSLAGLDDATSRADGVLALETAIAEATGEGLATQDRLAAATIWSRQDLAENAPGIDWQRLLVAAGLDEAERFALFKPDAIRALSGLVASEPVGAWRDWLVFHRLSSHAEVLPDSFGSAHAGFYERRLNVPSRSQSLERRVVDRIGALFPQTISRLYAERYFSDEEKRDVEIIAERIRSASIARIESDGELGEDARSEGVRKLDAMTIAVGYPERHGEIAKLRAVGDNAYAMTIAAERAAYAQELAALTRARSDLRWRVGAHQMGAQYLPLENALIIPASVLQPPFYDPEADAAANYGSIGTIIGREISRAIGPVGGLIDSRNIVSGWLTPADGEIMTGRSDRLARQLGELGGNPAEKDEVMAGQYDAQIAGLVAAYDAYRVSLDGREPRVIEGFTGDQRFYIAFAQLWATKADAQYARRMSQRGDWMAPRLRVATVRNVDAWYRAFDVQPNDALYLAPEDRVSF